MKRIWLVLILLLVMAGISHAEYVNFVYGTLAEKLEDTETTEFDITAGTNSATWPTANFTVVVYDASCSAPSSCAYKELIRISSKTSNTLTIDSRDYEGTTHGTHDFASGANIAQVLTAKSITDLEARGVVESEAFASAWNGDTTNAPSKNDVYDWGHIFDTDDDGKVNVLDLSTANALVKTSAAGVVSSSVITEDSDGKLTGTATVNNDTGNEVAYTLNYTTNKATSGNDTGLLISMTDTASPGTSYPLDIQVGASSVFSVDNSGNELVAGNSTITGTLTVATLVGSLDPDELAGDTTDDDKIDDVLIRFTTYAGAPTVNDDSGDGYTVGWIWRDTTNGAIYIATDVTAGAAVWNRQNTPRGTAGQFCVTTGADSDCELTDILPIVSIGNGSAGGGYINLKEDTDNGTDYVQLKGSDDSGTTPTLSIKGSPANTEDFTIALGANNNTITFGSTTGVTDLSIGALNLATTGTIQGAIKINSDANGMSQGEMTTAGVYGALYLATGAGTWNLPAAAAGMAFCIYSTTAAAIVVNPDNSDVITLNGTALSAGDSITSASGAGDFICLIAGDTTNWYTMGRSGTWTDTN